MSRRSLAIAVLLAAFAACRTSPAQQTVKLDVDTLRVGLRTAEPSEVAYLAYVATLVEQGRLPRKTVDSTFQWARRKPFYLDFKRFQYFKQALITQAARLRITLPEKTPDLTPTVNGRVVLRVLVVDLPAPNVTVRIRGTTLETVTNARGEFTFPNVPLGTQTLDAAGIVLFLPRTGSSTALLPTTPPSTSPATVEIRLK